MDWNDDEQDDELREMRQWEKAIASLSPNLRRELLERHWYFQEWTVWLNRVLGWDRERVSAWADQRLVSMYTSGAFSNDEPLWYVTSEFLPDDLWRNVPDRYHVKLRADVMRSIKALSPRSPYDSDYPWERVRGAIDEVVALWERCGFTPPSEK